MIEELTEAEIRAQLETNVLGALWVTQAALPYLREQSSGHFLQVSFTEPGNPVATREAILTLVDSDHPPLRLFLGESPLRIAVAGYGSRLASWGQWQQVAVAAQGKQD